MQTNRFLTALLCLLALATPACAQVQKSTLNSQVNQNFPDNNVGAITPQVLRNFLINSLIPSFQQYASVNQQAGASYTIQAGDYGQLVSFSNSGAIAVTLPQATGTFKYFSFFIRSTGTGTATITPQGGSTINGLATLAVNGGSAYVVFSDGTNYQAIAFASTSTTGLTPYLVTSSTVGAKCDGVTDDTTALKALGATISVAGGNALIIFPANANCLTFASGQAFPGNLGALFDFTAGVSNVYVQGNGATLTNNHVYVAPDTLYNFYCQCHNFHIDGLNFVQTNAVSLPAASPYGTVGVWAFQSSNVVATNLTMTGGQLPVLLSGTTGVVMENVTATNSIYGLAANLFSGVGVSGLFVRNLVANGTSHDRALFLKGVNGADIWVSSLNAGSNDVLISSDAVNVVTQNIKLNYTILARTAGSPASYVAIGTGSGATVGTVGGSVFRNIDITVNADLSGDGSIGPVVKFIKSTTSSLGLVFENIRINGRVAGVTNHAGNLFDLFTSADAPWSGESAKGIVVENLVVTGSATPTFYVDYAPFPTTPTGTFALRNVIVPGNYTDANTTNIAAQRFAVNASFGNGNLTTAFNNPLLFNNTALPTIASGQSAIGSSTTDGLVMAGSGSSNAFKIVDGSGNALLTGTASTKRVGVGTASPQALLHVNGNAVTTTPFSATGVYVAGADGVIPVIEADCFGACAPEFFGRTASGTGATPGVTPNLGFTFLLAGQGYDGNPNWGSGIASMGFQATQLFAAGANGQHFVLKVVKNGTTSSFFAMDVANDGGVVLGLNDDTKSAGLGTITFKPQTFASITACGASTEGAIASITDSNTVTWGAAIAGSSTNHVLGYCDGTNWTVAGK